MLKWLPLVAYRKCRIIGFLVVTQLTRQLAVVHSAEMTTKLRLILGTMELGRRSLTEDGPVSDEACNGLQAAEFTAYST